MRTRLTLLPLTLLACCTSSMDTGLKTDASADTDRDAALPPGAPFDTAADSWEYVAVDGAVCGNGSPLGVGVQRSERSSDVVLFFAGGGACWDATSCFVFNSAVHIAENVGAGTVLAEAQAGGVRMFLDRDDPNNAFPDASYVYVPYCTGDLYAGTRVATYDTPAGQKLVHHMGARNVDLILARMQATWPDAARVWVSGVSAGGYGATLSWWRVLEAFPDADVDVLSDSGLPIDPLAARMREFRDAWAPRFPPGCEGCETDGFGRLLPHYAASLPADARYGLLAYHRDAVIGLYFSLDATQVEASLDSLRSTSSETMPQRTFYVDGTEHVLSNNPGLERESISVAEFVRRFATRDPDWVHVGP